MSSSGGDGGQGGGGRDRPGLREIQTQWHRQSRRAAHRGAEGTRGGWKGGVWEGLDPRGHRQHQTRTTRVDGEEKSLVPRRGPWGPQHAWPASPRLCHWPLYLPSCYFLLFTEQNDLLKKKPGPVAPWLKAPQRPPTALGIVSQRSLPTKPCAAPVLWAPHFATLALTLVLSSKTPNLFLPRGLRARCSLSQIPDFAALPEPGSFPSLRVKLQYRQASRGFPDHLFEQPLS